MRFLIADDHAVVRRGLRDIIEDAWHDAEVHEVSTGQEALERVWSDPWDAAVLDVNMPGRSGLEVLKDIKKHAPGLPVLLLSVLPEDQFGIRALKAGASGYLSKEAAPEQLVLALQKALEGGTYVSAGLAEKLAQRVSTSGAGEPLHSVLSDREFEVLQRMAQGMAVTEVARDMALSVKTISTYRVRMLQKMGMKTNAELTRYANQHGLVP